MTQVAPSGQKTVAWRRPLVLCYVKPQISLDSMYRFFIIWVHMRRYDRAFILQSPEKVFVRGWENGTGKLR